MFSTGPQAPPTHWKQTVFLLQRPVTVNKGSQYTVVVLHGQRTVSCGTSMVAPFGELPVHVVAHQQSDHSRVPAHRTVESDVKSFVQKAIALRHWLY